MPFDRSGLAPVISYEEAIAARQLPFAIAYSSILIVDDYPAMLAVLRQMLRKLGFMSVFEATGGRLALRMLQAGRIKLVISDLRMEEMNGLELLRAVRSDHALASLPFILISGNADRAAVREAIEAGVTDFIAKPFTAYTLNAKLRKALGTIAKEPA